jgi:hypothetical protein
MIVVEGDSDINDKEFAEKAVRILCSKIHGVAKENTTGR